MLVEMMVGGARLWIVPCQMMGRGDGQSSARAKAGLCWEFINGERWIWI